MWKRLHFEDAFYNLQQRDYQPIAALQELVGVALVVAFCWWLPFRRARLQWMTKHIDPACALNDRLLVSRWLKRTPFNRPRHLVMLK